MLFCMKQCNQTIDASLQSRFWFRYRDLFSLNEQYYEQLQKSLTWHDLVIWKNLCKCEYLLISSTPTSLYFFKRYSHPPMTSITILTTHDNVLVTLVLDHIKIKWMHKMKLFNGIHSCLFSFKCQPFVKDICVRQVAADILRRGVELRYCKLFPQLKFYFTFYSSYKFP